MPSRHNKQIYSNPVFDFLLSRQDMYYLLFFWLLSATWFERVTYMYMIHVNGHMYEHSFFLKYITTPTLLLLWQIKFNMFGFNKYWSHHPNLPLTTIDSRFTFNVKAIWLNQTLNPLGVKNCNFQNFRIFFEKRPVLGLVPFFGYIPVWDQFHFSDMSRLVMSI